MAREVPYIPQVEAADCGAACLAMVVAYHGGDGRPDPVRAVIGSTRDGLDALALVRGAESLGLRGRGLRVELEDLHLLPPATILHLEFNHFVVFERVTRRGAVIVDPGHGRRVVPMAKVSRSFTGVALTFEPAMKLAPGTPRGRPLCRYVAAVLGQRGVLARALTMSVALRVLALALPVLTGLVVDGQEVGNLFYGSEGWLEISGSAWSAFRERERTPFAGSKERAEGSDGNHWANFLDAVRSGKNDDLHADISEGFYSSSLALLANISYPLGRSLNFMGEYEKFANDPEADTMRTRAYRRPYVVPVEV